MEQSIILTESEGLITEQLSVQHVEPEPHPIPEQLVEDVVDPGYASEIEAINFADEISAMISVLPRSQMRELMSRLDKRSILVNDTEAVRPIAERLLAAYNRKKQRSKQAYALTKTPMPVSESPPPIVEPIVKQSRAQVLPEPLPERPDNVMIPKPPLVTKRPQVVTKKVVEAPPSKPTSVTLKSLLN
jgi:hypothetical protein